MPAGPRAHHRPARGRPGCTARLPKPACGASSTFGSPRTRPTRTARTQYRLRPAPSDLPGCCNVSRCAPAARSSPRGTITRPSRSGSAFPLVSNGSESQRLPIARFCPIVTGRLVSGRRRASPHVHRLSATIKWTRSRIDAFSGPRQVACRAESHGLIFIEEHFGVAKRPRRGAWSERTNDVHRDVVLVVPIINGHRPALEEPLRAPETAT